MENVVTNVFRYIDAVKLLHLRSNYHKCIVTRDIKRYFTISYRSHFFFEVSFLKNLSSTIDNRHICYRDT